MGTVSRVHTFSSGAILTAAQLNNEFDNLLTSSAINGGLDATNLGVTAGQATASKALVVDSSRNLADGTAGNRINNLALSGTFESTGLITATAGITSGSNIVSDTDSTDDLGTTGVRWRNLYVDDVTVTNNVSIGGTLTLTGGLTLNGNVAIGDSASDTLTVNSTITSNLIFTDATYDIGASGATRPRDLHLSRNALMGGTLGVTGLLTATAGVTSGSNIVSDTDSTDDLGTTSVRWANLYVDSIGDTGQALAITAGSNNVNVTAGTLALTGAQTISSTLGVTGLITASGGVSGNVTGGTISGTTGSFSSTISTSGGFVTVAGNPSAGTISSNGNGQIGGLTANGLFAYGKGSTYDVALANSTTNLALAIPTGGTTPSVYIPYQLGVGTASPTGLGARTVNIKAASSAGADLTIEADNGNNFGVFFSGATANFPMSIYSNGGFQFATASDKNATGFSEHMRITSAGLVGIGTASPGASLDVAHSGTSAAFRVYNSQATDPYGILIDNTGANLSDSNYVADFRVGGYSILKLNNSGQMTFAPNSYGGASAGNLTIKKGSINDHSIRLEAGGTTSTYLEYRGYLGHSWYVDSTRKATLDATGLGVGQDSPSVRIHASGSSTNSALRLDESNSSASSYLGYVDTSGNFGIDVNGGGYLRFAVGGAERLRILANGNVGIGLTPSAWRTTETALQITSRAALYADSNLTTALANNLFINSSGYALIEADAASQYYQYQGAHYWQTVASGSAGANVSPSTVMVILSGGDVGLGTQSPEIRLSVTDTYNGSALTSNDIPAVQIINEQGSYTADNVLGVLGFGKSQGFASGVRAGMVAHYSGTGSQSSNVGAYLSFRTSADAAGDSTERARIDSSGNMIVGTTVSTPSGNNVVGIWNSIGTGSYAGVFRIGHSTSNVSGSGYIDFWYNGGNIGSISQNGTTAVAYNTTSDYRLKENVVGITDGITRIKLLKPSRFNFIAEADRTVDGFVAHEVSDIVPEAITGAKDAVDDEGNPQYQGIDQSKLVPLLTAALQEAITKIETLETKVAALEAA